MALKGKSPAPLFETGAEVEVSSVEVGGFIGAWFEGRVVCAPNHAGLYTVELDAFFYDADKSSPLRGEVEAAHIRPRPPACSPSVVLLKPNQPIEALHSDVWWSGIVSSVMVIEGRPGEDRDRKYIMRLGTGEGRFCRPEQLRPRMEWVQGEWVEPAPQVSENSALPSFLIGYPVDREQLRPRMEWIQGESAEPAPQVLVLIG